MSTTHSQVLSEPPSTRWETLRNGRRVYVRPIRPGDADALVVFHEQLSDTSRRLRFFSLHPHLTPEEVRRFTTVDHCSREALVAFNLSRVVGVGRFDATDAAGGEVAFVVADDWQHHGLGPLLLSRLATWAQSRGYRRFEADVLGGNAPMLRVFRRFCVMTTSSFEDGVVHLNMPFPEQTPPGPTRSSRARGGRTRVPLSRSAPAEWP